MEKEKKEKKQIQLFKISIYRTGAITMIYARKREKKTKKKTRKTKTRKKQEKNKKKQIKNTYSLNLTRYPLFPPAPSEAVRGNK